MWLVSPSRLVVILLSLAFVAVAVASCGGEDGSQGATKPFRDIGDAELSIMALSLADLGADFANFATSPDSGWRTNEASAGEDFDPQEEAKDLEQFGRVRGYVRVYTSPAPPSEEGVISVGSTIQLFGDSDGAADYFQDDVDEADQTVGKERQGATVQQVEHFKPAKIADESAGLRSVVRLSGDTGPARDAYETRVSFRRGRIIASVAVLRADAADATAQAESMAQAVDERIRLVLEPPTETSPTPTSTP